MTYDSTDSDSDGVIEANVDNELVSTNGLNITHKFAETPADVQQYLDNAGPEGLIVHVKGGSYTDSDWSNITLPKISGTSLVGLDMRGVEATLSSTTGPYIQLEDDSTVGTQSVFINVPRLDVSGVSSPGTAMELFSPQRSDVYFGCIGSPSIGLHVRSDQGGSGHHNDFNVKMDSPDVGVKVGDSSDSQFADRSMYRGQIDNAQSIGVWVAKGKDNEFWTQPENIPSSGVAYRIDNESNIIHRFHSGDGSINGDVFDIRAKRTQIESPSRDLLTPSKDNLGKMFVRPDNINAANFHPVNLQGSLDWSDEVTVNGTASPDGFGNMVVDAGTSGNAFIKTPGRIGALSEGVVVFGRLGPTGASAEHRFGIINDSNNRAEIYADNVNNSNWFYRVTTGGTVVADVNTGIPISGAKQDVVGVVTDSVQEWAVDYQSAASRTDDLSTWGATDQISEVVVSGSPGSAQTQKVSRWQFGNLSDR